MRTTQRRPRSTRRLTPRSRRTSSGPSSSPRTRTRRLASPMSSRHATLGTFGRPRWSLELRYCGLGPPPRPRLQDLRSCRCLGAVPDPEPHAGILHHCRRPSPARALGEVRRAVDGIPSETPDRFPAFCRPMLAVAGPMLSDSCDRRSLTSGRSSSDSIGLATSTNKTTADPGGVRTIFVISILESVERVPAPPARALGGAGAPLRTKLVRITRTSSSTSATTSSSGTAGLRPPPTLPEMLVGLARV